MRAWNLTKVGRGHYRADYQEQAAFGPTTAFFLHRRPEIDGWAVTCCGPEIAELPNVDVRNAYEIGRRLWANHNAGFGWRSFPSDAETRSAIAGRLTP